MGWVYRWAMGWVEKAPGNYSAQPGATAAGEDFVVEDHMCCSIRMIRSLDVAGGDATPVDEAASDPPSPKEIDETTLDELAKDAPRAGHAAQAGQEAEEVTEVVEDTMVEEEDGPQPEVRSTVHWTNYTMSGGKGCAIGWEWQTNEASKDVCSAQQVMAVMEIEHEDEPNFTQFMDDELDYMESYHYDIEDEQVIDETYAEDVESMLDKLSRPWTKEKPEVSEDEMLELDALPDFVEIARLRQQGVLIAPEELETQEVKRLSTKFVRSWREKQRSGVKCWLRRSRYVAREFAWLTPDREDLFSPASSALVSRRLPYCYLNRAAREEKTQAMMALDVSDAVLTVKQETPTVVTWGCRRKRAGVWTWTTQGFSRPSWTWRRWRPVVVYFGRLKEKHGFCFMWMTYWLWVTMPSSSCSCCRCWRRSTRCPSSWWRSLVMSVSFLKRTHVLLSKTDMVIYPHEKHFHKLFDLLGMQEVMEAKECPHHDQRAGFFKGAGSSTSVVFQICSWSFALYGFRSGGVSIYNTALGSLYGFPNNTCMGDSQALGVLPFGKDRVWIIA